MSTPFSHFFNKINQISPLESNFTEVLAHIALKPKILYFYGKIPKNSLKLAKSGKTSLAASSNAASGAVELAYSKSGRPKTVAIVGSRHNTRYGGEVAYKLAYELGKRGVIVISGLAFGIDSVAHRGCLDAGGTTIAVLGTPIDQIYPKNHIALAAEILEKGGAIISEYAPRDLGKLGVLNTSKNADSSADAAPQTPVNANELPLAPGECISKVTGCRSVYTAASFLYRNRIISGLSDIVVVAEAALRSGSLNTASHALEQGKDVFAVPGNVTNVYSQGCNKLIASGATPYTEPDDVLRILFPDDYLKKQRKLQKSHLLGDSDTETAVLKALSAGARRGEDIMRLSLLPPEVFNQTITLLEIKSRVRALGANQWALI